MSKVIRLYYLSLLQNAFGPVSIDQLKTKQFEVDLKDWSDPDRSGLIWALNNPVFSKTEKLSITDSDSAHLYAATDTREEYILYTGGIVKKKSQLYLIHPYALIHIIQKFHSPYPKLKRTD